jgi:hypothetical protein
MPCFHCKQLGHTPSKCPELHNVIDDGFFTGGNGGGGHDHDEEESLKPFARIPCVPSYPHSFAYVDQGKNGHTSQSQRLSPCLGYSR